MESYTCTEHIHTDNLKRILKANKIEDEEQLKMLNKLYKSVCRDGKQSIEFITKEKFSKVKAIGRLYPKYNRPSLQGLKRNVRKALAHHRYTDCDIKNAHPVLMHQVFEKENIECKLLTEYVNNRERFLEYAPKKEWTRMLNNGGPRSYASQLEKDFWSDVIVASVELFNKPDYQIYHKIAQIRNPDNKIGYAVSALATDIERKCITTAIQSIQEQGFKTGTIIHDGFLIEALEIDDKHFRTAENEIRDRVGFNVELVKSQLNDFDPDELWDKEHENIEPEIELNDASAAKEFIKFMDELGHHFTKCCGTFLWFNPTIGLWKECPKADELRTFMNGAEHGRLGAYSQFVSKQDNLFTMLKAFTEEDPTFFVKAPQTTYHKLAYNNGIYNFETKQLEDFNHEVRFFNKLEWDWETLTPDNLKLADEIRQKIIYGTFDKERGDYYEKVLARSLAGEVQDKNFFIVTGDGNSGKGVNSDLLENAFGDFVGVFNSGNLTKKVKGDDTEKTLGFMTQLKNKRIVYANETSPDCVFDAGMIKTFASGGDTIKARPLFKDPQTFKLECSPFLFCNDFNTIRGADDATSNRLRFLESQYAYLTGSNYENKKKNPNVRLGDDNIKNVFIKRQDVLKTFALMICNSYSTSKPIEPDCVQRETQEWVQHDDMETIIDNLVEFDEGSETSFGDVYNHLTQNGVAVSKTKAGTLLKKLGFNQIEKKVNKKKGRYYQNLKLSSAVSHNTFGDC
jgi:phage/plasmid-associated DNA primase